MKIEIAARRAAKILLLAVLLLTLLGVAAEFVNHFGGPYVTKHVLTHYVVSLFISVFYFARENPLPIWYQTCALLLCSFLLATIARVKAREKDSYALHWKALSVIFLLLSVDEAAIIHDLTIDPLLSALPTSGFLYYAWAIPAGVFILIIGTLYLRFLMNLPARARWLFLAASILCLGGALSMELIGFYYASQHGKANITFAMVRAVTKVLEMLGIVVFLYALMSYIALHIGAIEIRFKPE